MLPRISASYFSLFLGALIGSLAHAEDSASSSDDGASSDDDSSASSDQAEVMVITGAMTAQPLSESVISTDVITREELRSVGAGDASEVLETEAGLQVTRTFRGAAVQMEGLAPEHTLVLVDGFRVPGRRDGVIDLSRFPTELIDHIEVIRGAESAQYGSEAMGGVINIITRHPDRPFGSSSYARYGSRNAVELSETVQVKGDDGWAIISPAWRSNHSFDWNPADPDTDVARSRQGSLFASGRYDLTGSTRVLLGGDYRNRDSQGVYSEQTGAAESASNTGAVYDWENLTDDISLRLGVETHPDERSMVSVKAQGAWFRSQFAEDQRLSDEQNSYDDDREALGQLRLLYKRVLPWGHTITTGLEGMVEAARSERLDTGEDWAQRQRGAAFIIDEWRIGSAERVVLMPSARVDDDSHFGTRITPSLSLRGDPSERLALRASVGTGYRAPSFREMYLKFENPAANYIFVGNPDLQPESSLNIKAGPEWSPVTGLRLRVELFRNTLTNMFQYAQVSEASVGNDAVWTYENVSRAMTTGADASMAVVASDWFQLRSTYSYLYAVDRDTGEALEQRSTHAAGLTLVATHPVWGTKGSLRGRYASATPFWETRETDAGEMEPYQEYVSADPLLSARLEQRTLRGRLRVFAGVDNILNVGDDRYFHYLPRTWYGGLMLDLPDAD